MDEVTFIGTDHYK